MDIICPYCNNHAVLVDSSVIYGKSYGMMWLCRPCNAYVGCHKGTTKPLGRISDRFLREKKRLAHFHFDKLWKGTKTSRTSAYIWLSKESGIPRSECHIGMMDIEQCDLVIELSKKIKEH